MDSALDSERAAAARLKPRKQLLAGHVPAHPAARADQEQRAEPPRARPRPRADGRVARGNRELAEHPDPDRLPSRRILRNLRDHGPIIPVRYDIPSLGYFAAVALSARWPDPAGRR